MAHDGIARILLLSSYIELENLCVQLLFPNLSQTHLVEFWCQSFMDELGLLFKCQLPLKAEDVANVEVYPSILKGPEKMSNRRSAHYKPL